MKKLYQLQENYGRMGSLTGTFVAEEDDVRKIMGKTVYFGEVLGKHSDVSVDISEENLTVLTDDQTFIAQAEVYGLVPSGHNPFDHYEEELEDDEG